MVGSPNQIRRNPLQNRACGKFFIPCLLVVLIDIFITYTAFGLQVPQVRQRSPESATNTPILSDCFWGGGYRKVPGNPLILFKQVTILMTVQYFIVSRYHRDNYLSPKKIIVCGRFSTAEKNVTTQQLLN